MKTETKLLELTSDVVFKAFMMSDKVTLYKSKLIHLITGIEEEKLNEAVYVCKEFPVNHKQDKVYRSDIIVEVENCYINIEMNREYYEGIFVKNSMYMSKIRSEELDRGEEYTELKDVIQINIDSFGKFKDKKLVYEFGMREKESGELEYESYKSYHINLDYLRKNCYNESNELRKVLGLFIMEDKEELGNEPYMIEAIEELERISRDEKIIGLYDKEKQDRMIEKTKIKSALKEGMEKGSTNRNKEIALKMIKKVSLKKRLWIL